MYFFALKKTVSSKKSQLPALNSNESSQHQNAMKISADKVKVSTASLMNYTNYQHYIGFERQYMVYPKYIRPKYRWLCCEIEEWSMS